MMENATIKTDVVVVGSGAGGGTVARELALAGRDVVILEKGKWHRWLGSLFSIFPIMDKYAIFSRSKEGVVIDRAITAGGSTVVYAGNAFDPPSWLNDEFGIDIGGKVQETKEELDIKRFPDDWYGPGTMRLREIASEMDIDLAPQQKFVDPERCDPSCDQCMMGCKKDAKWTSRRYLDQAMEKGARLILQADVKEVLTTGTPRSVVGVRASTPEGELTVEAPTVVVCAGGMGTPPILNRSGIWEAGANFFMDPMVVVLGIGKDQGTAGETTFTLASTDFMESDGFILGNVGAKNAFISMMARASTIWNLYKFIHYPRAMGMFAKIDDSAGGYINLDGTMSKPMTREDQLKMSKGASVCEKIMVGAGADPRSIGMIKEIGGHPGGTAAIGQVVDRDLQTEISNLYVCDASILPRSPGCPPVLTLIGLGKWLAARI